MFNNNHISLHATALSTGLVMAACLALLTVCGMFGLGLPLLASLATLFVGMQANPQGFFLAVVWGFILGNGIGFTFAWFYNHMV